jgi:ATP-dependent DNA helicase RecG
VTINREQILEAAKVGEGTDWEFKSAKGGLPGSFWETYSAMANSEGGTIVLGARENGAGLVVLDGLPIELAAKHQKAIWDGLHDRQKVSSNLLTTGDVSTVDLDRTLLLAVRIPRADRQARPVFLGPHPLTGTYRRRHEGDYRCSEAEVRRMLADAEEETRDARLLEHFTLEDLDAASLQQYRRLFQLVNEGHPWLNLPDVEFLTKLGGWRRDRSSGKQGPTLAGLLLLGKEQAILDPDAVPDYMADYRECLDPRTRWTDRIHPDGTWECNLFQFYGRVWPKVAHALPVPFRLEGVTRKDETPAHEALREAFVNAIVHADYGARGGIVVERFPDRVLLTNPGTLLVSEEQYWRGGVSECRNPILQKMFAMLGRGERAGSGVDKIKAAWRARHWRGPSMRSQVQPDRVELTLPLFSLLQPETVAELKRQFGPAIESLDPDQLQALAIAKEEGLVSNPRMQSCLTKHPTDIGRMLKGLVVRGMLVSDDRRRWTTYCLTSVEGDAAVHRASLFDGVEGGRDSEHKVEDSIRSQGDSIRSEPLDSLRKAEDSIRSQGDSIRSGAGFSDLDQQLVAIARPIASRQRAPSAQVREAILQLCSGRYLSAERIGSLLRRNPVRIRQSHLKPLVTDGLLRLKYPGTANRPDQAYTATDAPKA